MLFSNILHLVIAGMLFLAVTAALAHAESIQQQISESKLHKSIFFFTDLNGIFLFTANVNAVLESTASIGDIAFMIVGYFSFYAVTLIMITNKKINIQVVYTN